MEQMKFLSKQTFMDGCCSGTIDMHLPLEITNHIQTMKTEVSVLKHLLIICQLEKVPLLDILSELRCQLKYKLHELIDSNPFVYKYIENVIGEWRMNISPHELLDDSMESCNYSEGSPIFNYQCLVDEINSSQKGGALLEDLEKELSERQSTFTPMTRDYVESMKQRVSDASSKCNSCLENTQKYTNEVAVKHSHVNLHHSDIVIDMSCKPKPMYLEYCNQFKDENPVFETFLNDSNDLTIPDNINTMFLNYLLIINMIKKELNYINDSFKQVLVVIEPHTKTLDTLKEGLGNLVTVDDPAMDGEGLDEDLVVTRASSPPTVDSSSSISLPSFSFF
jgi:hypothetical protein